MSESASQLALLRPAMYKFLAQRLGKPLGSDRPVFARLFVVMLANDEAHGGGGAHRGDGCGLVIFSLPGDCFFAPQCNALGAVRLTVGDDQSSHKYHF